MIKEVLMYSENKDILTQKSQKVDEITEEVKCIIQDLKDTLEVQKYGVGLSAIQIGIPMQICTIKYNSKIYTLINPTITRTRGTIEYEEGCLSVPELSVKIPRAEKVWCDYIDENGNKKELAQGGLLSVIIQHELDHFKGECPLFNKYEEVYKSE